MLGLAAGLFAVGAGIGEDIGDKEDDKSTFDLPKGGLDERQQGRVEETAQIRRHIEQRAGRGVKTRAVRDDGGDFGDADVAEGAPGEVKGGLGL